MKKMKIEEKKVGYSLIFFYEDAASGGALEKRCSQKFHKIHRKKPVSESLIFNKAPGLTSL